MGNNLLLGNLLIKMGIHGNRINVYYLMDLMILKSDLLLFIITFQKKVLLKMEDLNF